MATPDAHPLAGPLTEGMRRDVERLERRLPDAEPQLLALLLLPFALLLTLVPRFQLARAAPPCAQNLFLTLQVAGGECCSSLKDSAARVADAV